MTVIEVIFIYIRLLSVKGCHSKGALITIQTHFRGLTRAKVGEGRGGGRELNEISDTPYHIYIKHLGEISETQ